MGSHVARRSGDGASAEVNVGGCNVSLFLHRVLHLQANPSVPLLPDRKSVAAVAARAANELPNDDSEHASGVDDYLRKLAPTL